MPSSGNLNPLLDNPAIYGKLISASRQKCIFNEMNFTDLYKKLESCKYYIFSYRDILYFYPGEKEYNIKKMLSRWKKKGWLLSLKRGLYQLAYPGDILLPDIYIANRLYGPSYVSLETALSNYSIIPEVSMAVTSITTKATRRFKNKYGLFIYRTVKPACFAGYYIERQNNFDVFIAEPEKAVVDYIYFKRYQDKKFDLKNERLDKDIISHLDKKKVDRYARLYNMDLEKIYAYL